MSARQLLRRRGAPRRHNIRQGEGRRPDAARRHLQLHAGRRHRRRPPRHPQCAHAEQLHAWRQRAAVQHRRDDLHGRRQRGGVAGAYERERRPPHTALQRHDHRRRLYVGALPRPQAPDGAPGADDLRHPRHRRRPLRPRGRQLCHQEYQDAAQRQRALQGRRPVAHRGLHSAQRRRGRLRLHHRAWRHSRALPAGRARASGVRPPPQRHRGGRQLDLGALRGGQQHHLPRTRAAPQQLVPHRRPHHGPEQHSRRRHHRLQPQQPHRRQRDSRRTRLLAGPLLLVQALEPFRLLLSAGQGRLPRRARHQAALRSR